MLLCSKNHIIMLPSPDHYALGVTISYAHHRKLTFDLVMRSQYHVANSKQMADWN